MVEALVHRPLLRPLWLAPVAALALLVLPARAHAQADIPFLTTLVAQSASQLTQLSQTITTLKQTYDETRKYVGMAEDAVRTFEGMRQFGEAVIRQPDLAFGNLFPDAAALRREIQSPQMWGQGTGELQRRISLCLGGASGCTQVYERISGRQAQQAIADTFGTVPVGRDDLAAIDAEAARAIVGASVAEGQAEVSRAQYDALLTRCTTAGDVTACQAAANMATILQARGTADLNEQMALNNRLKAVELASEAAKEKRKSREAKERVDAVRNGFRDMNRPLLPRAPVQGVPQ
jgi:hypothetical protein